MLRGVLLPLLMATVVLPAVSCGSSGVNSDSTTPPTETVITTLVSIEVVGGATSGGIERVTVTKGDMVDLHVESDVADEIHVHGYDLSKDVEAGGFATISFTADIAGRFEVELENRGVQIAELTVTP